MQVVLNLPDFVGTNEDIGESAEFINAMLACVVTMNRRYLKRHSVPHIYSSGVRYGRTTEWEVVPGVLRRKVADCKSLAPWLTAVYLNQGRFAQCGFRYRMNPRTGFLDYHILVDGPNGWEDPSRVLGMGKNENQRA